MRTRVFMAASGVALLLAALTGAVLVRHSRAARGASPRRLAEIDSSFRAIEDGNRNAARDRWDPDYVVSMVGRDPDALFAWVRDNTYWIPYRGVLRGPVGVLMDRQGNSLDRALLLAKLLERAGDTVRLAHGEVAEKEANERIPELVARQGMSAPPSIDFTAPSTPDFELAAAEYHLDGAKIARRMDRQLQAFGEIASELDRRTADQTQRLLATFPRRDADADWQARYASAIGALRDHWWVQRRTGATWVDMDLMANVGETRPIASLVDTLTVTEVGRAPLHHEIAIRVVTEQWVAGKGTERTVIEHVLRPSELIGKSVVMQFWPMEWVGDSARPLPTKENFRARAIEQRAWASVLLIDAAPVEVTALIDNGDDIKPKAKSGGGGPMGGLGAALAGALGDDTGGPSKKELLERELSAVWLEYEIRAPGVAPRRLRRAVFDLIGPAARTGAAESRLTMNDERRLRRSLALTMRTEILPMTSRFAPDFVVHLAATGILANQELLRAGLGGRFDPTEPSTDSAMSHPAPMLSPLYSLALARFELGRNAQRVYIDRLDLLTNHVYAAAARAGVVMRDATDIIANEVGVPLFVPDGIQARVAQGVFDTNAESLVRMVEAAAGNAGDAYAAKHDWVQLAPNDAAAATRASWPADASARMREAVSDGYLVVAPAAPITDGMSAVVPWWRVDLASGDVLGFGDNGWGFGPGGEDSFLMRITSWLVAPRFRAALGRFGLAFTQQYMWCLTATAAPLMGREGALTGLKLGIVESVHECVGDALAIAAASAVLPLIFMWLSRVAKYAGFIPLRMPRPPKLPPPPPPPTPMGTGGGGGPPGPKTPPNVGVPNEPPPPPKAPRAPGKGSGQPSGAPGENAPSGYSGGDPSADPFGKTHPDPTKPRNPTRPTRPSTCAPTEPDPGLPNPPKDVTDAQIRYAEAYADFEQLQQSPERQAAFERYM